MSSHTERVSLAKAEKMLCLQKPQNTSSDTQGVKKFQQKLPISTISCKWPTFISMQQRNVFHSNSTRVRYSPQRFIPVAAKKDKNYICVKEYKANPTIYTFNSFAHSKESFS